MTSVLLTLAVLAAAVVVVLVSPTRRCARCKGQRVTRRRWTGRITACPRCGATGRRYRRGAVITGRAW